MKKRICAFALVLLLMLLPDFQGRALAANNNPYPVEKNIWSGLNGKYLANSSEYYDYLTSIVGKRFSNSSRCQAFVYQAVYNCFGKGNLKTAKYCCATAACSSYRISTSEADIPIGAAVYFSGSGKKCNTCGQNAGHVAIYIGNGEIIHCASVKKDGVKYPGFIRRDPITLVTKTWGYKYQGWGWQGGFEIPQQANSSSGTSQVIYTSPKLSTISQNMQVDVGAGYTLRLCSTVNHNKEYAIGSIPNEATIFVYGVTTQQYDNRLWAKVSYNGTDGWVNYEYLRPITLTPTPIKEYSITFDANGGTGRMAEVEMTCGVAKPLPANSFKRPQYRFAGWAESPNGSVLYADQQSVDLSSIGGVCIGLYAIWEPELQATPTPVTPIPITPTPATPTPATPTPAPKTPVSIWASSSSVAIDLADSSSSRVSLSASGDLPASWYWNLAAAGPFVCSWDSNDSFTINATGQGAADLEVWLCDSASDDIVAKTIIKVTVVDNTPPAPVAPTLSISQVEAPSSIKQGGNFGLRGIITTDHGKLTSVKGWVLDGNGTTIWYKEYQLDETSHDLRYSLNEEFKFGQLAAGSYTYRVEATAVNGSEKTTSALIDRNFTVQAPETPKSDEPELNNLGYNMKVNVGKGSTLRFCSYVSTADRYEIGSIPNDTTVYVYGTTKQQYEDRTWAKIKYNGVDGWVNYKWLK